MTFLHRFGWMAAAVLAFAAPAAAQTPPQGNMWSRGTTVNVFTGVASDSSDQGPFVGGAVGWEVTPAFGLEGSAAWLDRSTGADSFAAALQAQVGFFNDRTAVPFIEGGVGLYRASFENAQATIPDFYRLRMAPNGVGIGTRTIFMDPSLLVGGGVNLFLSRHVAIRPAVEATLVMRDSEHYLLTTAAVHVAYHFEDHPVTPRGASR